MMITGDMPFNNSDVDKLKETQKNASKVLVAYGLAELISKQEIEEALAETDDIYTAPVILGVLMRAFHEGNEERVSDWLTGISAWKNLTPHADLGNISPLEYGLRYPPGREEQRILRELMNSYRSRIQQMRITKKYQDKGDLIGDFERHQNAYLALVPILTSYRSEAGMMLDNRGVIIAERTEAGVPESKRSEIGIRLNDQASPEEIGKRGAAIEDTYQTCATEIQSIKKSKGPIDDEQIRSLLSKLKEIEPYMKSQKNYTEYGEQVAHITSLGKV